MYPYPYAITNRGGISEIPVTSVNVGKTEVVLNLPNHAFYGKPYKGYFTLKINSAIPAGTTTTLPLQLQANGVAVNLMNLGGQQATVADLGIPGTGVALVYYDKETNLLQFAAKPASA